MIPLGIHSDHLGPCYSSWWALWVSQFSLWLLSITHRTCFSLPWFHSVVPLDLLSLRVFPECPLEPSLVEPWNPAGPQYHSLSSDHRCCFYWWQPMCLTQIKFISMAFTMVNPMSLPLSCFQYTTFMGHLSLKSPPCANTYLALIKDHYEYMVDNE